MARKVWTGSLNFGLVNIPVGLVSATEKKDVSFHQRERGTNARIRYKRVAEGSNREVEYDDIVKGYELSGHSFVTLTPDEIEAAELEKSKTIEISDFVDLADIEPIYYEKSYYLAPANDGAHNAYALLRDAMQHSGLAGVASFVMRGKEYLAVIRPWDRVVVLETMLFADEVRDAADAVGSLPRAYKKDSREMKAATNLIKQLSSTWDPERYRDTYRERLLGIVKAKAKGREIQAEPRAATGGKVVDLMDALQRSVDEARSGGSKRTTKTPAKRTATTPAKGTTRSTAKRTAKLPSQRSAKRPAKRPAKQSAKQSARKSATSSSAPSSRKSTSSRARATKGVDVGALSKQDLYDRAADLGVAGRSKMSRTQLERAVTKAS